MHPHFSPHLTPPEIMKTLLSFAILLTFALMVLFMDLVNFEPNVAQSVFLGIIVFANMMFSYVLGLELKKN
jgi:hypothetical protein